MTSSGFGVNSSLTPGALPVFRASGEVHGALGQGDWLSAHCSMVGLAQRRVGRRLTDTRHSTSMPIRIQTIVRPQACPHIRKSASSLTVLRLPPTPARVVERSRRDGDPD